MFPDDETLTEEQRLAERRRLENAPVEEAGGGVAEGFEQAEELLVEHAQHTDQHGTEPITHDAREEAERDPGDVHGEADDVDLPDAP